MPDATEPVPIEPEMLNHLDHVVDDLVNSTDGEVHRSELTGLVHDCYRRLAENATVTQFLPILAGRCAKMRLRAKSIAAGDLPKDQPEILIIDRFNAARSQTAAALIRFYAPGRFTVVSAGISPKGEVDPRVVEILRERGVRLTDYPKPVTPELLDSADDIITINNRPLEFPDLGGREIAHWDVEEPSELDLPQLRSQLVVLDGKVRDLLARLAPDHTLPEPLFH